jgi:hypothetical protein
MAKVVVGKYGAVTDEMKAKRRKGDIVGARQSVHDALAHWVSFFANNKKYETVGTVVLDENKSAPPALCEAALKKRPLKGGILDDIMRKGGALGSAFGGEKKPSAEAGSMPDFVKDAIRMKAAEGAGAADGANEAEDLVKDEL